MPRPFALAPPTLAPFRRTREERVLACRVFDIDRVELEDGTGAPRGEAFTIRASDWCNVVAVTRGGDVVLVWQYRFGSGAFSLEIPGGVIDPGEPPEAAARRELREETGYEAERWEPLLTVEPNPALQDNRCFTFVAYGAHLAGPTGFDPQEELETVLVPAARIADLLDGGQVTHSLVQGALEAFWRRRGGAWEQVERLVADLDRLEQEKLLDLARRLRPGLTAEDIANPHDFPELADPDWQHREGALTGIRSVLAAIRAERRRGEA